MKTIKVKKGGKSVHKFTIEDSQLKLAKKLGISEKQYIEEMTKLELKEKNENKVRD